MKKTISFSVFAGFILGVGMSQFWYTQEADAIRRRINYRDAEVEQLTNILYQNFHVAVEMNPNNTNK